MNTTICFMGQFSKTFLFREIAAKLQANGVRVCWILTNPGHYEWLKEFYEPEQLLLISREMISKRNAPIGDFKINELVYGDRVFKHEIEHGLEFYTNIQKPIYDYILKNKIRFVFGEVTWGHEVLILRICRKYPDLHCTYLQCSDIRIPNARCAFFMEEGEFSMVQFDEQSHQNEVIKVEKPKYHGLIDNMVKKSKSVLGRLDRVKRFITGENINRNDPNVIVNNWTRFRLAAREELYKTTYGFLKKAKLEDVENDKFVFFGFHKQPEASIDVHGRYNEDQFLIVANLWRMLPPGWKVVVKEHSNAIGDRSYGFYKKLLRFPGIILVDERIDSKLLITKSQLVVTVCGTMSYEAALMKKPSITLSKVFFNSINYCKLVPFSNLAKYESLMTLVDELNSQEDNRVEFSNYLMRNSFSGYVSDMITDPTVMADDNVEKLSKAFLKLISQYAGSAVKVHEPALK